MKLQNAKLKFQTGTPNPYEEYEKCGPDAKAALRPFYDVLLVVVANKPAATAAAKKSMLAFFAVMKEPPGSIELQNALTTALAELELEAP